MTLSSSSPSYDRSIAVDLHKDYVVVGAVNARLETVLSPRRIELNAWPRWATEKIKADRRPGRGVHFQCLGFL